MPAKTASMSGLIQSRPFAAHLVTGACVGGIAWSIIVFNGGIDVGGANHVALLPFVRRLLDPGYLPGDFGISLRLYHHRVFAYLVAWCSAALGEDRALIALHLAGMTLLAVSLWYLCRAVKLPPAGFVAMGLFLATNWAWTGKGLEWNYFVSDADIYPITYAHGFVLLALGSLLQQQHRLAVLWTGLATLFHLQIGLIGALVIAPFYALWLKALGVREFFRLALLFFLPASPALLDLILLVRKGLMEPPSAYSLAYYIDFRHPHHFELISATAALWVAAHVVAQAAAWYWLRRAQRTERRHVGMLLAVSLILTALALIHFTDYYLVKQDKIAYIQFIRLSPLITVLGTLALIIVVRAWADEQASRGRRGRLVGLADACLILIAVSWAVYSATRPDTKFYAGVRRHAEQRSSWSEICLWIKEHGPRNAIYLAPPGNNDFVYLAERSDVADFKNNPDGALHLAEWFERLRDLSGGELPQGRGFENQPLLNQAFAKLSNSALITLGEKYHARYAVLPKSSATKFAAIYQNDEYRLVELPLQTDRR